MEKLANEEELRNVLAFLPENTVNRIMGPRKGSMDLTSNRRETLKLGGQ